MIANKFTRKSSVFIRVHLWTKILLVCSLLTAFGSLACSIPNLESASCVDSRNALREFYSYHFGNSMTFSREDLKAREKFLTPEFTARLAGSQEGTDPFTTGTSDIPKAFRTDECRELSPERTALDVVLYWKDDNRTEERKIKVEMAKRGGEWLVDDIAVK
jgi:hypothetical protein